MMSSSKAVNARGESGFTLIDMLFVIALIGVLSLIGIWAGGWRLAILVALLMLFIAAFGQWEPAMVTRQRHLNSAG